MGNYENNKESKAGDQEVSRKRVDRQRDNGKSKRDKRIQKDKGTKAEHE